MKLYGASRQTGAPKAGGLQPRDLCKSRAILEAAAGSTVQQVRKSSFDDLCQIYPCQKPAVPDNPPQRNVDDEVNDAENSGIAIATKVDHLRTADIVKVILQPAVLDAIVTELEHSFLSEWISCDNLPFLRTISVARARISLRFRPHRRNS